MPVRYQIIIEIVALHRPCGLRPEAAPMEVVATTLDHGVDVYATSGYLGIVTTVSMCASSNDA